MKISVRHTLSLLCVTKFFKKCYHNNKKYLQLHNLLKKNTYLCGGIFERLNLKTIFISFFSVLLGISLQNTLTLQVDSKIHSEHII